MEASDKRHQNAFCHSRLCAPTLEFPPHLFNLHALLLCCQLASRPATAAKQPKVAACSRGRHGGGGCQDDVHQILKQKLAASSTSEAHSSFGKMQQAQLSTVSLSLSPLCVPLCLPLPPQPPTFSHKAKKELNRSQLNISNFLNKCTFSQVAITRWSTAETRRTLPSPV